VSIAIDAYRAVAETETLLGTSGVVDLWYWLFEPLEETVAARCLAVLSDDERWRYERYHFDRDRRLYLATRALVRSTLARYLGQPAGALRFASDPSGRPYLQHPDRPLLHFNLTNTPGLVVCVVSAAHAYVGVDAEAVDRTADYVGLSKRFFSPQEAAALVGAAPAERPRRFFDCWTLKESYVKARGEGLALPLDRFAFDVSDDRDITFSSADDDARAWRFALLDVSSAFVAAVAARTGGAPLSLRTARLSAAAVSEQL
jgi:4'-phosphopantetheinyl transferase